MAKSGAIYTNGIVLEKHEQATIKILADNGYDVTLIRPSTTQGQKTPDIVVDGLLWEMKSPEGKGKWTIKKHHAEGLSSVRKYNH